jgi:hypothetical protein
LNTALHIAARSDSYNSILVILDHFLKKIEDKEEKGSNNEGRS